MPPRPCPIPCGCTTHSSCRLRRDDKGANAFVTRLEIGLPGGILSEPLRGERVELRPEGRKGREPVTVVSRPVLGDDVLDDGLRRLTGAKPRAAPRTGLRVTLSRAASALKGVYSPKEIRTHRARPDRLRDVGGKAGDAAGKGIAAAPAAVMAAIVASTTVTTTASAEVNGQPPLRGRSAW